MKIFLMSMVIFILFSNTVYAGEVEIVKVVLTKNGSTWNADVTLLHADSGWNHYADAWRLVSPEGKLLKNGERILFHPHEDEQPFTRSQSGIVIPAGMNIVYVEAHDKVHGWSKQRVKIDLSQKTGNRYEIH